MSTSIAYNPAVADTTGATPSGSAGTASGFPTASSAGPTESPRPSSRGSGSNGFYNNQLFYILIAVLGAFALVSIINLARTRRRRGLIMREAERLGLMVPGMPGYVPMRERPAFVKADGWRTPDWWEVEPDEGVGAVAVAGAGAERSEASGIQPSGSGGGGEQGAGAGDIPSLRVTPAPGADAAAYGARGRLEMPPLSDLRPLALIPEPVLVAEPPKPWSPIPYFPNYVSYLSSAHDPRPPRFDLRDAGSFNALVGEEVQVVVALRMPTRDMAPAPAAAGNEDDDAVMREWGGLELGVASVVVQR